LTGIENVRDHDLGAATLEQIAARVPHADGGAYGVTFGEQLGDYGATGSSGCAGDQNFRFNHGKRRGIAQPERRSPLSHGQAKHASGSIRERVLKAAFTRFREQGFSGTSMARN
jgi:hypothetical protein